MMCVMLSTDWSGSIRKDFMRRIFILTAGVLLGTLATQAAQRGDVVVGVNTVGVERMNEQQQDAFVEQLKENGVKVVRLAMDEKYTHFITRAYERGIGTVAVVFPWFGSEKKARMRPSDLSKGLIWGQAAFSTIDPEALRTWFSTRLTALEAGVRLTAFEFGNEINTAGYDGDFPLEATGRELGLSDLNNPNDHEWAAVAAGYRVYLKALAELKHVRDASKLNKTTPIISAGLADGGPPGKRPHAKTDGVSLPDTLQFLRQNGLDELVDGYGVHFYPSNPDPNTPVSERVNGLGERALALCTSAKPCWLTEWGFANRDLSCPIHDETRVKLIQTEREAFKTFVKQGRLAAVIYYNWTALHGYESQAIFRCGALTDAGKLALQPL
jgi:hypothetical protein